MTAPIVTFAREQLGFELYPRQSAILTELYEDNIRVAVWRLGRRSGKDRMAGLIATFEATIGADAHRANVPATEQLVIPIVAASQKQARICRRYVGEFFRAPSLARKVAAETEDEVRLRNGITIATMPCFAASVRGLATPVIIFSELAHYVGRDGSPIDAGELWAALTPGSAQFDRGRVLALSTPKYSVGFFHELCERAASGQFPDMRAWHASTSEMAPNLAAYVEAERAKDPALARREFDAEWDSGVGSVFLDELVRAAVVKRGALPPVDGIRYQIALDPAATGDVFTCLVGHRAGERIIVDRVTGWRGTRANPLQIEPTLDEIAVLSRAYNSAPALSDQWSAQSIIQSLRARGIRVEERPWRSESKVDAVAVVRQLLYAGRLELPDHPELIREMVTLEQRPLPSGRLRIAAPAGGHDDHVSALLGLVSELAANSPPAAGGTILPTTWRRPSAALEDPTRPTRPVPTAPGWRPFRRISDQIYGERTRPGRTPTDAEKMAAARRIAEQSIRDVDG